LRPTTTLAPPLLLLLLPLPSLDSSSSSPSSPLQNKHTTFSGLLQHLLCLCVKSLYPPNSLNDRSRSDDAWAIAHTHTELLSVNPSCSSKSLGGSFSFPVPFELSEVRSHNHFQKCSWVPPTG
jgi:hypothetical protein